MEYQLDSEKRVLMKLRLATGPLTLIYDLHETLTIELGGRILPGCIWRECDMHKAVSEFRLIGRQLHAWRGSSEQDDCIDHDWA